MEKPTGTVTFIFTDIEGSTKLSQQFVDAYPAALEKHHAILRSAIESNNGYVFRIAGDAFCCAFGKAEDAVKAAIDIQLNLANEKWEQVVIKIRIGLHTGTAEWNGERYMGYITLARTARVMSTGYGEQIVISNDTYELCRDKFDAVKEKDVTFRDLGERRLKDVIQPIRLFQIISPGLREEFPPLKTLDSRPNNLPVQLTSFIGREDVMEQVKELFKQTHLLTIIGFGGGGKTRLSMQVGADMIDDFNNGVFIAELAPVSDPSMVVQTIMNSLEVKEEPGRSLEETLTDYLKEKELLLILDNCEHLINECAELSDILLSKCPKLKIIATSREALNCAGEQTFIIPPLSLPDASKDNTPEQLTQYESVRLFIERALSVSPNFRVTNTNAPALAEICNHLDGIPLAIELAAARVKVLSLEKIYERLNDRFSLLTGGRRTALPRQQTLRAMIDWSYDLLSEKEKTLWNRLSVFQGGWTLESAEEICSDEKVKQREVLDLLIQLAEKSIIIYDEEKERYRILETMKQYGEEKLIDSEEQEIVLARHLNYYMEFSVSSSPKVELSEAALWLERLESEHSNFQSAIYNSIKLGETEKGGRTANALSRFWIIRGHSSTGKIMGEKILEQESELSKPTLALIICNLGNLSLLQGNFKASRGYFEKSLKIGREIDDNPAIANSLIGLGSISVFQGDIHNALVYYQECLEISRAMNEKRGTAMCLNNLGMVAIHQNEYEKAKDYYEESLAIYREIGLKSQLANPLHNLGLIAENIGEFEQAEKYYKESLALNRESGSKRGIANTLLNLGLVSHNRGNYDMAQNLLEECGAMHRELEDKLGIGFYNYGLGMVYSSRAKYNEALKFFEVSIAIRKEIGDKSGIINSLNHLGVVYLLTNNIDKARSCIEQSHSCNTELGDEWATSVSLVVLAGVEIAENNFEQAASMTGIAESKLKSLSRVWEKGIEILATQNAEKLRETLGDDEFRKHYEAGTNMTTEEVVELAGLNNVK